MEVKLKITLSNETWKELKRLFKKNKVRHESQKSFIKGYSLISVFIGSHFDFKNYSQSLIDL